MGAGSGVYARRTVEDAAIPQLQRMLDADPPRFRCALLLGEPGDGAASTLARGIVPRLRGDRARLRGEWHATAPLQWCLSVSDVPETPPSSPEPRLLLVAGTTADSLPAWLSADGPRTPIVLTIGALSLSELHDYLESRLGGPVDLATARTLGVAGGFVPATLAWLVGEARSAGVLDSYDGVWQLLDRDLRAVVEPHVRSRLAAAAPEQRDAAFRLALAQPVAESELTAPALDALGPLRREGLIGAVGGYGLGFRAPVIAETVGALCPEPDASQVHARSLGSERPTAAAIRWSLARGIAVPSERVEAAISAALANHDWAEAISIAETALSQRNVGGPRAAGLHAHAAMAARFLPDVERSRAHLDDADEALLAGREESGGTDDLAAARVGCRTAVLRAELLHYSDGEPDAALDVLAEADRRLDRDLRSEAGSLRGELLAHRIIHLCFAARPREAREALDAGRALLRRIPPGLRARVRAHEPLMLVQQGRPRRALRSMMVTAARSTLTLRLEPWAEEEMRTAYVVAALSSDGPERFPGLGRQFDDARDSAYRPDLVTYFHARATWQYLRGDIRDAHRLAERALATSEYLDPSGVGAAVVAILAETAALLGERDRASALISRFRRTPSRASGLVDGSSEAHIASAMLLLGATEASSRIALASERHAAAGGFGSAADVLRTGVRFGRRRSARALLRISDRLDGELHRMSADHARALLADDALALWAVAERLAQAGLRLWSAEAAAAAANVGGAPAALRRRAVGHCRAYAEEQPLPGHPLLRLSGPAQPALTRREREVSDLIAAGLSNDEIAARLRLSLRTVEGHVSRLYRKTGAVRRSPARRSASQE